MPYTPNPRRPFSSLTQPGEACDCPNCCDCGGESCGCGYCRSCNVCAYCQKETESMNPAPRIVCVLEPCGAPLLVLLPDGPALVERLDVYAHMGQHSEAHRDYIRAECRDVSHKTPRVWALVREWCNLGPDKIDPDTVQFFTRAQSGLF